MMCLLIFLSMRIRVKPFEKFTIETVCKGMHHDWKNNFIIWEYLERSSYLEKFLSLERVTMKKRIIRKSSTRLRELMEEPIHMKQFLKGWGEPILRKTSKRLRETYKETHI